MNCLNIILYLVTPIIAFGAFFFSLWSFQQNRKSKRSFFAPSDEDHIFGAEDNTGFIQTGTKGIIILKNYGSNPTSQVDIDILTYNKADVDGKNKNPNPFRTYQTSVYNPIPNGGQIKIKYKGDVIEGMVANYLILKIKYLDRILNKFYTEVFLWFIGDENILEEVLPNDKVKLLQLLNIWEKRKISDTN